MFSLDPQAQGVDLHALPLRRVLYSLNTVTVATSGREPEEARVYVCTLDAPEGASVLIGLYLLRSAVTLVYRSEREGARRPPMAIGAQGVNLEREESEAREFAEGMGFVLEPFDLEGTTPLAREEWLREQGVFLMRPPGGGGRKRQGAEERPEDVFAEEALRLLDEAVPEETRQNENGKG